MPTLNPKRNKQAKVISLSTSHQERKERSRFYGSKKWRELRKLYLMYHPLDEIDLLQGITTPAEDVHHKVSFMSVANHELRLQLFYDWNNLVALSKTNHNKMHHDEKFKEEWIKVILGER